ncbi:MAG: threonylcarbamoyl-AMP synthase [Fibrobacteres bacterium]|nr:threonylcarbamoyl-AMP synthase [Fibrobacterota bacterium]
MTAERMLPADNPDSIAAAVTALKNEGVIIHPTETVYGFAANAYSLIAIRRVDKIKKRKAKDSFLLLVRDMGMAKSLGLKFDLTALKLAERFWPGPLTIILPAEREGALSHLYSDFSLAVRVSPDPFIKALFKHIDFPIISTSANISGEQVITYPEKLQSEFGEQADLILTRGTIRGNKPSTIIHVANDIIKIVREGAISESEIYAV